MVGSFLGFAVAGEGKAGGFQVDFGLGGVRGADGESDVVLLGVGGRGALGPEDCGGLFVSWGFLRI